MAYVIILILVIIVLILALLLLKLIKDLPYLSDKEREYIKFTFTIFTDYGSDLGIQSKDQHDKLVEELNKIKKKLK
jgi:hypothetical protein